MEHSLTHHTRALFPWGLVLTVLAFATGCGGPAAPPANVLRINLTTSPASLDPAYARDQAMTWCTQQLYEGLVALDDSMRPVPALANRWEVTDSGRTYTFFLRQNVRFHPDTCFHTPDSTRSVTAHDVVFSLTRICDPATASPGLWIFSGRILGLDDFRAQRADTLAGIRALNDTTVQIRLQAPYPPFLTLLTMPYGSVLPPEAVRAYGKSFRSHPVGTGPYRFKRWDEGRSLVFQAHPHYREPGLPRTPFVQFRFQPDRLLAFVELVRGNLDMVDGLDPALKDEVLAPDGALQDKYLDRVRYWSAPQLTTEYLGFQTDTTLSPGPWAHPLLHQAVAYAIDRHALVRYLRNNTATPGVYGFIPPATPGFSDTLTGYRYAPERARTLLAQAGFPNGRGLPPLRLVTSPAYREQGEFLQAALAQVGIRIQLEALEGAAAREQIYQGRATAWRASWVADYPDGENFLALFYGPNTAPGGPNTTRYANPAYDARYQAALRAPTDSARYAAYARLERQVLDDCPVVVLYYYRIVRFTHPRVQGFPVNPMDLMLPLKEVSLQ